MERGVQHRQDTVYQFTRAGLTHLTLAVKKGLQVYRGGTMRGSYKDRRERCCRRVHRQDTKFTRLNSRWRKI